MVVLNDPRSITVPEAPARPVRVALVAKPGGPNTGVGRYVQMLKSELGSAGVAAVKTEPVLLPLPAISYTVLRRAHLDLAAFLRNYPIWARYPQADVVHLTSQNLASLLLFRRPRGPAVVTVHDIIPYMLRRDSLLSAYRTGADRLFDHLAMRGLRRANMLIAASAYTGASITKHLGISASRITVIHLGIDQHRFRPQLVSSALRDRYGLPENRRYLIYVGSEDPRKNLPALIDALAKVRRDLPDVELIKVGRAHFEAERHRLDQQARSVGVRDAIHFLGDVPEDDLPSLYNLAAACILPSLYEGFGFPVVEAQACGTPVICARATSLPEIVGEAAILFDPHPDGAAALAAALLRLLTDPNLARELRAAGIAHAASFQWSRTAQQVRAVYESLLDLQG